MGTVNCFYTTVISLAPGKRAFGFLGTHGVELNQFAQYSQPGDLLNKIANGRRTGSRRNFQALQNALLGYVDESGVTRPPSLAIIATPAVHLYDSAQGKTVAITSSGGTLGTAAPCESQYLSQVTGAFAAQTTPVAAPVASQTLTFTAPVTGFTASDVLLTLGGVTQATPGITASSTDNRVWTIGGLTAYTGASGTYVLSVPFGPSGVVDVYGNALAASPSVTWVHS